MNRILKVLIIIVIVCGTAQNVMAGASKTDYPVVFAHGAGGMDDILGFYYFGNDYGVFVGDPCDKLFESSCNPWIDDDQKAFAASLYPIHSSEVRGEQLYNEIENYMATSGATHVHIIGHSQGGVDARKAARRLYEENGYRVVKFIVTVSASHRGAMAGKFLLEAPDFMATLSDLYGDIVYGPGNDAIAMSKSLFWGDYDPNDGIQTGVELFNENYPVSDTYAAMYASFLTGQDNFYSLNPALRVMDILMPIDGDGYCEGDCDGDGVAGTGDGYYYDGDSDGLVGINSMQMGYRLKYRERFGLDKVEFDYDTGYVGNVNAPTAEQMTSKDSVINADHMDVVGVGPDHFDEEEFYAAIFNFLADNEHDF